mmetsp:Transcript_22478/g.47556  ORF Transcript_22478/g.47556 Transcript_22478/m.47556 type:complete len:230 (-) Transcript_22478:264-953(-)
MLRRPRRHPARSSRRGRRSRNRRCAWRGTGSGACPGRQSATGRRRCRLRRFSGACRESRGCRPPRRDATCRSRRPCSCERPRPCRPPGCRNRRCGESPLGRCCVRRETRSFRSGGVVSPPRGTPGSSPASSGAPCRSTRPCGSTRRALSPRPGPRSRPSRSPRGRSRRRIRPPAGLSLGCAPGPSVPGSRRCRGTRRRPESARLRRGARVPRGSRPRTAIPFLRTPAGR